MTRRYRKALCPVEMGAAPDTLNLFEDFSKVREFIGEETLLPFARALYCFDLFQQVYFKYFSERTGRGAPQKPIGTHGILSLSGRLSPASMPLALLTNKKEISRSVSKDDYRAWQEYQPSFRKELFALDYDHLSSIAPKYFPTLEQNQRSEFISLVRRKHYEIDSLISTLRFKQLHYDCDICHRMDCYCHRVEGSLSISLREVVNSNYEVQMFQKIWFQPEPEADTVSVSANLAGFTMIRAVSRAFGFDWDHVKQVAEVVESRHEVISMSDLSPRLIIVPKTRGGSNPFTRSLLTEVLSEAKANRTRILHMTHYGFCNGLQRCNEPLEIVRELLYPHLSTTTEKVIFDYDTRAKRQLFKALRDTTIVYKPRFV